MYYITSCTIYPIPPTYTVGILSILHQVGEGDSTVTQISNISLQHIEQPILYRCVQQVDKVLMSTQRILHTMMYTYIPQTFHVTEQSNNFIILLSQVYELLHYYSNAVGDRVDDDPPTRTLCTCVSLMVQAHLLLDVLPHPGYFLPSAVSSALCQSCLFLLADVFLRRQIPAPQRELWCCCSLFFVFLDVEQCLHNDFNGILTVS